MENTSETKTQTQIGDILVRRGKIRRFQLEFLLKLQKAYRMSGRPMRLGDLIKLHRVASPKTVKEALTIQKELPQESVTEIIKRVTLQEEDREVSQVTQKIVQEA